jgi:hypothetical protein
MLGNRKLDGIDLDGFTDGATVQQLFGYRYREVPPRCGVYVVIRDTTTPPTFLQTSSAGRFKDLDPSYSDSVVKAAWVPGARIVYIGKASGARGLKQRIRQLIDFGFGKPVGHRGGRSLWHLSDYPTLRLQWLKCACPDADAMETRFISQFKAAYDARPFANCVK